MTSVPALDRTATILGGDLFPDLDPEVLVAELCKTKVLISADAENLASAAAQSALVSSFLCLAQTGFELTLDLPDVRIEGPQPPLRGGRLAEALIELGADLITPARTLSGGEYTDFHAVLVLGSTPAPRQSSAPLLRIGGGPCSAELRVGRASVVEPFTGTFPIGPVLAGVVVGAEITRIAAARISKEHVVFAAREFDLGGPREVSVSLPEIVLGDPIDLGKVDFISAGAITNACLFTLLRLPSGSCGARVFDRDLAEESNLNRYPLLRRSRLDDPKVEILAGYSTPSFVIEGVPHLFEEPPRPEFLPLSAQVIVGADDIPARWTVQRQRPQWLCIGGTSHFAAVVSEHVEAMPCAACLHPEDDPGAPAELPTIAFTSMLAGVLQAHRLLSRVAGLPPALPTWGASFNLQAEHALEQIGLAARADCPVGCEASRTLGAR